MTSVKQRRSVNNSKSRVIPSRFEGEPTSPGSRSLTARDAIARTRETDDERALDEVGLSRQLTGSHLSRLSDVFRLKRCEWLR
jgi:hypothetical protein